MPAKLTAPTASQLVGATTKVSLSCGSDYSHSDSVMSARSTQYAMHDGAPMTSLKEHVQRAFVVLKKTVGVTESEINEAGTTEMDAHTCIALEQMNIPPSAENYVLARKALNSIGEDARKGVVKDATLYWYMAIMYVLSPIELASFASPTPGDCAKVRKKILDVHFVG